MNLAWLVGVHSVVLLSEEWSSRVATFMTCCKKIGVPKPVDLLLYVHKSAFSSLAKTLGSADPFFR